MAEIAEKDNSDDPEPQVAVCSRESVRNCCCTWNRNWRLLVLFVIVAIYIFVGGGIFVGLEGPNERDNIAEARVNQTRLEILRRLLVRNITASGTLNESQAYGLIYLIGNLSVAQANLDTSRNWEFGPALFFATTVVTTIGYGSISPVTLGGRLFFIFYAMAGIPIALVFLGLLGDMLNRWLERFTKLFGKRAEKPAVKIFILISSAVGGLIFFVFIPAIIFYAIESWDYFESIYFCFVTLTTVGFGDFVPSQASGSLDGPDALNGLYRVATAAWIWIGLAFVSLLIARVQNTFTDMGKRVETGIAKIKKRNRQEEPENGRVHQEMVESAVVTSDEKPCSENEPEAADVQLVPEAAINSETITDKEE